MEPMDPQNSDNSIWPPPPTQEPPAVAATSRSLSKAQVFGEVAGRMLLMGLALGAICGALFGLAFFTFVGAIFGTIYGLFGGLLLGLADGLALAALTCFGFFPLAPARVRAYRQWTTLIIVLVTLAGAGTLSLLLFGSWGDGTPTGGDTRMSLIPTAIATAAAGFASRRVAAWYEKVSETRA